MDTEKLTDEERQRMILELIITGYKINGMQLRSKDFLLGCSEDEEEGKIWGDGK